LEYTSGEACTFLIGRGGVLNVIDFDTEAGYDKMTLGESEYHGTTGPVGVSISAGDELTWESNGATQMAGFEICIGDPCAGTTNPSDDGSDGNFYCINGGSPSGISGSCGCTDCNEGFGGANCAVCAAGYTGDNCENANACIATSTPSDDGSDGNFYCINGGSIGGIVSSCTCSCISQYAGENCELEVPLINTMTILFNTLSSNDNPDYVLNTGDDIMTNGGTVMIDTGHYKCSEGTCAASDMMVVLSGLHGVVKCHSDDAICNLDGEGNRIVFAVAGTGGQLMTVRALTITNGKWLNCGGLGVSEGGIVDVVMCVFIGNQPLASGAGGLGAVSGIGENGRGQAMIYYVHPDSPLPANSNALLYHFIDCRSQRLRMRFLRQHCFNWRCGCNQPWRGHYRSKHLP
jgi:hypothetical protein